MTKAMMYWTRTVWLVGLLLVLLGTGREVVAQQDAALAYVERAVEAGDAEALLSEATERVEIALFGSSTLYSRAQALYVMEHFFQEYPPVQFSLQHTSAADGNWFASGPYYHTHSDRPLRVYVRLRVRGKEQWEVREVRIEERLRK